MISLKKLAWVSNTDKQSSIGGNENINKKKYELRIKRKARRTP